MPKYRKKPVVVEAFHLVDLSYYTVKEALKFMGQPVNTYRGIGIEQPFDKYMQIVWKNNGLVIPTLEGNHLAKVGDYIIKGVKGEVYPCKPDIFLATYEEIDNVEAQEEKKTYLSEYLKEHNCSYKEFMEQQEMYDGFCPVGLEEAPCPIELDCMGCWNQEVKGNML